MLFNLSQFAQDSMLISSDPTLTTTTSSSDASSPVYWVVSVIVAVILIAAHWRIFTKAGKPGWASIIPIYNTIVLLEIIGRPIWWFLLLLIPFVNIIVLLIISIDTAKVFGKSAAFGIIMLFFLSIIGYPMLAWGDAKYTKPKMA